MNKFHLLIKHKWADLLILFFLLVIYFFFRLYNHSQRVNFSADQGTLLLDTWQMWQDQKPKLVGPQVLTFGYDGRYFFHGPYVYYFLLPGMLIGDWQPIAGSISTILWNSIAVILLYLIGKKAGSTLLSINLAIIFATTPFLIYYTSFIWNPNLLPLICVIFSYLLLSKSNFRLNSFLLGITTGVGLLLHYQIVMLIPLAITIMIWNSKKDLKKLITSILLLFSGISLASFPIVLFELKHQFYNLKTIMFILQNKSGGDFHLNFYYFMAPIIVLTIVGLTLIYQKINLKNKKMLLSFLFGFSIISFWLGIQSIFIQPKQISLPELKIAKNIILIKSKNNYNIANITTGNTRANELRYLLISSNHSPQSVENYQQIDQLWIVAKNQSDLEIELNQVWEIQTFNGRVIKNWQLSPKSEYSLYLLEK